VREHFIERPENLQERLNAGWGRTNSLSVVSMWNRLGGVMGGDEEGSKLSESLKIDSAVFVKLVGQGIQVCNTIFDDPDPLGIKPLRAIEEIHDASADHGIQRHQRSLVLVSHLRPPLLLMGFPER
jgi:hypothetical protein